MPGHGRPPGGPVRPRLLWIVLVWVLAVVIGIAGLVGFGVGLFSGVGDALPTTVFGPGEPTAVTLDPADKPAIYVATQGPVNIDCEIVAATLEQGTPSLTRPTGTVTVSGNGQEWELAFVIGLQAPGRYQVTCEGDDAVFGIGREFAFTGSLSWLLLPAAGLLVAVVTTVVVTMRRRAAA